MRTGLKENIRAALAGFNDYKHVLHLYTPQVDRRAIQGAFRAMAEDGERVFYACEEPLEVQEFESVTVIPLEEVCGIEISSERKRIIVDNTSSNNIREREEFLEEISRTYPVMCAYDISQLRSEDIEGLVRKHDKLILTADEVTLLSSQALGEIDLSNDSVERFVKEYLDLVVLALILNKPMCGTEIIDEVHKKFNVLLSPGTLYPLLHGLKENGLLEREYVVKKKIYKPAGGGEGKIGSLLSTHLRANEFLNNFLKSSGRGSEGTK